MTARLISATSGRIGGNPLSCVVLVQRPGNLCREKAPMNRLAPAALALLALACVGDEREQKDQGGVWRSGRVSCEALRQQHARASGVTATFSEWVASGWPSGRYDRCLGLEGQLTNEQRSRCYGIAITHGHLAESIVKDTDRRAWREQGCESFLGHPLPRSPLPPALDSAYTDSLWALADR